MQGSNHSLSALVPFGVFAVSGRMVKEPFLGVRSHAFRSLDLLGWFSRWVSESNPQVRLTFGRSESGTAHVSPLRLRSGRWNSGRSFEPAEANGAEGTTKGAAGGSGGVRGLEWSSSAPPAALNPPPKQKKQRQKRNAVSREVPSVYLLGTDLLQEMVCL